jgi:hypothetical protein
MASSLVLPVYLAAFVLAAGLLYWFGCIAWPYHTLCIALGIAFSLVTVPEAWAGPMADMVLGSVVLFLLAYGAGGLIFHPHPHHKHA